jgi:transposase
LLGIRAQLVGMQTKVTNQLRGILKTFGLVLGKGGGRAFDQPVEAWAPQTGLLGDSVRALLAVLLHRMWVTGEAYRWSEPAASA